MKKHITKRKHTRHSPAPSSQTAARSDYYTNLMLITVVEAMILLIGQLLIYNGFAIPSLTGMMWNNVVPILLAVSAVSAVSSLLFICLKGKKMLWSLFHFSIYTALLMCLIRYIPNSWSETLNRPIVNSLRGQQIGGATSVLYIAGLFTYYSLASRRSERQKH